MNVRNVIVTREEEKYGVKYKFVPDARALGTKFKRDATKIRSALDKLPMQEISKFVTTKEIEIEGFKLTEQELSVARYFSDTQSNYHAQSTNEVLVILDVTLDATLVDEGLAREVINRIQRLRKKAGLNPTDEVRYFCKITADPENQLANIFKTQKDTFEKYLRQGIEDYVEGDGLVEEEQEVNDSKFLLKFVQRK